jgi:hypothetical protein
MTNKFRVLVGIGLFLSVGLTGVGSSSAAGVDTIAKIVFKAGPYTVKLGKVLNKLKKIEDQVRQKANKYAEAAMKLDPILLEQGGAAGIGARVGFDDPQTVEFFEGTSKDIRSYGFTIHPILATAFDEAKDLSSNAGKCAECVILTKELRYLEGKGWSGYFERAWYEVGLSRAHLRVRQGALQTFTAVKRIEKGGGKIKNIKGCNACTYVADKYGVIDLNRSYTKKELAALILANITTIVLE